MFCARHYWVHAESTSGTYDDQGRLAVGYEGGKEATTTTKTIEPEVTIRESTKRGGKAFIHAGQQVRTVSPAVAEFKDKDGICRYSVFYI